MEVPTPRVGLVIRYGFLWSRQAREEKDESSKDRPAAIIVKTNKNDGDTMVWVCPITHHPDPDDDAIEIPEKERKALGLDNEKQWLVANEINRFIWPGFDLRPIPGSDKCVYGMLTKDLFEQLRARVQKLVQDRSPNLSTPWRS